MFAISTLLYLGLGLIVSRALAVNDSCSDSWMFIDIHYRQVDARPEAFSYGLFIGVGENSQNQSLWPSVTFNETRVANNDYCSSPNPPAHCDDPAYTHGHYGPDSSLSWQEIAQYKSLDDSSTDSNFNVTFGQDQLNMFTHFFDPSPASKFPLPNHPLTVLSDARNIDDVFFNSGSLGLGPSSTALKQLIDLGRINRNVVSMYLGTRYPRAGGTQNGSIVMGGYDAGRFIGEPHKYAFGQATSDNSPLKVHVKQMSLVTADGSTVPFVTDDGFDGYITTDQYPMELPSNILTQLSSAVGASPANNEENTLAAKEPFSGNLTITLEDGYEITFPSEWITNASNVTPFSASTLKSNTSTSPLIFGTAFLHHLYMTIDYDASSFYLADAKVFDNYVQPESLCAGQVPIAAAKPKVNKFVQSGMIGAILGGLIGGTAVCWVLFFFIRKRIQSKRSKNIINKMEGGGAAPRKSSLRRVSMFDINRVIGKPKPVKDGTFGDAKRVSLTDSESDAPPKKSRVTIVATDSYEMNQINDAHQYQVSALPTPYTATTPRTGNPLLGGMTNYSQFDDRDDSDLPPGYRHERQGSDGTRNKLALKLNTNVSTPGGRIVTQQVKPKPRSKLDAPKLSPKGHSFLRKLYPAS